MANPNRLFKLAEGSDQLRTTKTTFTAVLAALCALPAAAQETPPDTTTYESAPVPVWIAVQDVEDAAGAHRVRAAIIWDEHGSKLRFGDKVLAGDLVVSLAAVDAKDATKTCTFTSPDILHGSKSYQSMRRDDDKCLALGVESLSSIGVTHLGSPMVCLVSARVDGKEDPSGLRYYGCYWAEKPSGPG